MKVKFDISADWFSVVFLRPTPQKTPQITPQIRLTELEQTIAGQLKKDPNASSRTIAEKLGISQDTVREYLEKLKQKGAIHRVGPDRGGHWEVLEK